MKHDFVDVLVKFVVIYWFVCYANDQITSTKKVKKAVATGR